MINHASKRGPRCHGSQGEGAGNSALHIDGLVQDCSNSIANALELLQSCT